ncbi:glycoside hydrolase family 10 protein [Leptothoe sp. PORK10 BA2]|uniref:glycoside hydrolase family 10 protein n=1 Tax=Leptothoe sp. PORK10 BA2 TaxID=3110254 RepID=UPI002B1F0487|nr:glycoside hydrolase family 10 protein [Leptothoe sp. PORK10 BA2]MEA5464313.1 glycoside hydrolase family 10 protein [Leptothoe sp. PORK10 BA2]
MAFMKSKLGRYGFLGGLICLWISWMGLISTPANAVDDWRQHPCVKALAQGQVLSVEQVHHASQPISQGQVAQAVLTMFPGKFAAANTALGLTFEGKIEAEQLLVAALGNAAGGQRAILRSQALAVLATGAALPYQARGTSLLEATWRDSSLISIDYQEGVAAALGQGVIPVEGDTSASIPRLYPNRSASYAMVANLLCAANPDPTIAALVPQRVQPGQVPPQAAPQREIRGAWLTNIDSQVLFSRPNLESGLQRLASLNFNTVYPTVWNWGYTLYPSAVAQRTFGYQQGLYPDLDNTGERNEALEAAQGDRDMLQELISLAHPLGLRVIPWFEFGFMAPADSALARSHPEWLTQKADGSTVTPEGSHGRVWLNPFHPEVQQFMLDMVSELAANYPIDGFQVDDHFGLPVVYGYDPYTVSLYRQEHRGQAPPQDIYDAAWTRWRADKITAVMERTFAAVKARQPRAVLSVSPNPHEFAYKYFLQDWDTWVNRGYVEELIVQLYRSDLGRFVWEMNRSPAQAARRHIPTAVGVLSGLRGRPVPMARIQEQVRAIRDRSYAGVSFFFYESLWWSDTETLEQRQQSLRQLFPSKVPAPRV